MRNAERRTVLDILRAAAAAVLASEIALLLHELSHALLARSRGQNVTLASVTRREPVRFADWRVGVRPDGWKNGSRVSREVPARL